MAASPWVFRAGFGVALASAFLARPSAADGPVHHLSISGGLGYTDPTGSVPGGGTGGFAEVEYSYRELEWLRPIGYVGGLITGSGDECGVGIAPCDVSTKAALLGGKLRLMAPIPYLAPYVEGGIGASLGSVKTRVGNAVDRESGAITYHVPIGLGLAIGEHHEFELGVQYVLHPAMRQIGSAFALGFGFALD